MNVLTIASFVLALVLLASGAAVNSAEQPSEDGRYPYTGPNTPVMTTA